jgi:AcrR family transcriptional regulator
MPANDDIIQQQILQAAQQLFQKHGYQKVTMDDVARAIGKGRSSLYYYYKNKDEVFNAVMDTEISDILAEISSEVAQASTAEQKLLAFGITRSKISRKRKAFFDALETGMNATEISQYAQKKLAVHKKIRKEESSLLHQILTTGAAQGEYPTPDPKDLDTLIFLLITSLRGLRREMALHNNYTRMEPAITTLVSMTMLQLKQ